MSLENDYNLSYKDAQYLIPVLEGLAINLDLQFSRIKAELRAQNYVTDIDVEYLELYLNQFHLDLIDVLIKNLISLQELNKIKKEGIHEN